MAVSTPEELVAGDTLDLLLIAALELAPHDRDVGELVRGACAVLAEQDHEGGRGEPAELLGRRLLSRAGTYTTQPQRERKKGHI